MAEYLKENYSKQLVNVLPEGLYIIPSKWNETVCSGLKIIPQTGIVSREWRKIVDLPKVVLTIDSPNTIPLLVLLSPKPEWILDLKPLITIISKEFRKMYADAIDNPMKYRITWLGLNDIKIRGILIDTEKSVLKLEICT